MITIPMRNVLPFLADRLAVGMFMFFALCTATVTALWSHYLLYNYIYIYNIRIYIYIHIHHQLLSSRRVASNATSAAGLAVAESFWLFGALLRPLAVLQLQPTASQSFQKSSINEYALNHIGIQNMV